MKNIPKRMCVVCRQMQPKNNLLRVVKSGNDVVFDKTGKIEGRGAYVCKSNICINDAIKRKSLNRVFGQEVDSNVYNNLLKEIKNEQN